MLCPSWNCNLNCIWTCISIMRMEISMKTYLWTCIYVSGPYLIYLDLCYCNLNATYLEFIWTYTLLECYCDHEIVSKFCPNSIKAGRDGLFSQNKLCAAKLWNDDHQNCDVVNVQKWGQQKFTLALQVFWLELDGQHASECTWVYWFCWLQIRMLRSWGILLTARGSSISSSARIPSWDNRLSTDWSKSLITFIIPRMVWMELLNSLIKSGFEFYRMRAM